MTPTNFSDTLCGKALNTTKTTIWHFFLTVCFVHLAFLLSTSTEELTSKMSNFCCDGLLGAGLLMSLLLFLPFTHRPAMIEIIGYIIGAGISIIMLKTSESYFREIGTSNALHYLLLFVIVYAALIVTTSIINIIWTFKHNNISL